MSPYTCDNLCNTILSPLRSALFPATRNPYNILFNFPESASLSKALLTRSSSALADTKKYRTISWFSITAMLCSTSPTTCVYGPSILQLRQGDAL